MAFADLHMHSSASDGTCKPDKLAQEACTASSLHAFALTDHDTLDGLLDAQRGAAALGLDFVPGVEITTKHDGRAVHLLGYFVDPSSAQLAAYLDDNRQRRADRVYQMADLMRDAGFPVSGQEMRDSGATPNRPLLARLLMERGCVADVDEAFKRYLGSSSPYYVDAVYPDTLEAIELVRAAGGYAFVAHPARYRIVDLIEPFARAGITGVEAYHSLQTREQSRQLVALAGDLGLAVSGGSDWHGDAARKAEPGGCGLDEQEYESFLRSCGRS